MSEKHDNPFQGASHVDLCGTFSDQMSNCDLPTPVDLEGAKIDLGQRSCAAGLEGIWFLMTS